MGAPKLKRNRIAPLRPAAPGPEKKLVRQRVAALDQIRGAGIVMMIFFHLCFDLKTFASSPPSFISLLPESFWRYFPEAIGTIFFFCFGASAKLAADSEGGRPNIHSSLRRFLALLAVALGITISTAIFTPKLTIYFGVIHCMAVCLLLLNPLVTKPNLCLGIGLVSILAGAWLKWQTFSLSYFAWLGFYTASGPAGGDNYPIFPWFGVALAGAFLGPIIFNKNDRPSTNLRFLKPLQKLGQHSLLIYLIHQPILILVIMAAEKIQKFTN